MTKYTLSRTNHTWKGGDIIGKRNKYKDQHEEIEETKQQVLEEHKQDKQHIKEATQKGKSEGAGKATAAILKEVKKLNKDKVDTKDYTQLQQDYMKNLPSVERIRADKEVEMAKMKHDEAMHLMNINAGLVTRPETQKDKKKKDDKEKPKKPADPIIAMAVVTGLVAVSLAAIIIVILLQ